MNYHRRFVMKKIVVLIKIPKGRVRRNESFR